MRRALALFLILGTSLAGCAKKELSAEEFSQEVVRQFFLAESGKSETELRAELTSADGKSFQLTAAVDSRNDEYAAMKQELALDARAITEENNEKQEVSGALIVRFVDDELFIQVKDFSAGAPDPQSAALLESFAGQWLKIPVADLPALLQQKFPKEGKEKSRAKKEELAAHDWLKVRDDRGIDDAGRRVFEARLKTATLRQLIEEGAAEQGATLPPDFATKLGFLELLPYELIIRADAETAEPQEISFTTRGELPNFAETAESSAAIEFSVELKTTFAEINQPQEIKKPADAVDLGALLSLFSMLSANEEGEMKLPSAAFPMEGLFAEKEE